MATYAQRTSAELKCLTRVHFELVPQEFIADYGLFGKPTMMTEIVLRAPEDSFMIGLKKLLLHDRIIGDMSRTPHPLLLNNRKTPHKELTNKEKKGLAKISSLVLDSSKARDWVIFYTTVVQVLKKVDNHYRLRPESRSSEAFSIMLDAHTPAFGAWLEILRDCCQNLVQKGGNTHPIIHGSDDYIIYDAHLRFTAILTSINTADQKDRIEAYATQIAKEHHVEIRRCQQYYRLLALTR